MALSGYSLPALVTVSRTGHSVGVVGGRSISPKEIPIHLETPACFCSGDTLGGTQHVRGWKVDVPHALGGSDLYEHK